MDHDSKDNIHVEAFSNIPEFLVSEQRIGMVVAPLFDGFISKHQQLTLLTESEIFANSSEQRKAGKIGKKFEEVKGKEELPKTEPIQPEDTKENMFPVSSKSKGPFYEMKDGKISLRNPYEMLDEMEKKESNKIEPIVPEDNLKIELEQQENTDKENQRKMIREVQSGGKIQETNKIEPIAPESKSQSIFNDEERNRLLSEVDESGNPLYRERQDKSLVYLPEERKSQEEDKVIDSLFNEKSKIKKSSSSPFGLDMKMFEQKLPEVPKASLETEESGPMGVSLTSLVEEEESITEPTSITQLAEKEEGIIEPVTIEPEEPKETEIQTALREAREKQLSYLEELRQKEQIETPSRGIEKIAKIGGRLGEIGKGLFGKPEVQEEIQQYEMPEEAEYEYTPTDEMGKFDISNLKQEYLGPDEIEAPEAPEIGIPEIPTPQGINEQVFGGQTPQTGGEGSAQTINVNAKIEITGNPEFTKLLDPRKLQSTVESIFVTSMSQKTNVAQKVNSASQESGMGVSSYSSSLDH
jgi:hypothetical protein